MQFHWDVWIWIVQDQHPASLCFPSFLAIPTRPWSQMPLGYRTTSCSSVTTYSLNGGGKNGGEGLRIQRTGSGTRNLGRASPNVEVGTWGCRFSSSEVVGFNPVAFVSGDFLVLIGLLGTLFLGGCRGWKTGGGSGGIGGLMVRLCVGRGVGAGALTFFMGETFQLRSSQGVIC